MIKELDTRKQTLRAELDADVAKWLAKGNAITELSSTRTVEYRDWTGTDAQAAKQLASAGEFAVAFRMSEDKFVVLTRQVSFPMPYLIRSEARWSKADVKKWHVNWRKG